MNSAALGWGLALLALAAGYASYGWPGMALAITVIIFWLLLQFTRALRVLREAAGRPVGSVDNAVMLHAKLNAGMRLPQILKLTRSLGKKVDVVPEGREGPPGVEGQEGRRAPQAPRGTSGFEESFAWADEGGDQVQVHLRDGRLTHWTLHRAAPTPQPEAAAESEART